MTPTAETRAKSPGATRRPATRAAASAASAAVIALLGHLCASFGMFAFAPQWTVPLVVGVLAALGSRARWAPTALGTAAGAAIGATVWAPWFLHPQAGGSEFLGALALFVAVSAAASAACALALDRVPRRATAETLASLALVAVIVAAMWTTAAAVDSGAFSADGPSLNQTLSTRPELGNTPTDADYYLRLFYDVHEGKPYYDSVAQIWLADASGNHQLPIGVTSYRLPTIFYLWRLLPADGASIVWAFLAFASVAVVAAWSLGAQLSRPGIAALGALAVATAYLLLATSPWVTFVDGWGMALTLAGFALYVASLRRESAPLLWGAVAAMLAGALLRELLVYPMLIALAAVALAPAGTRLRAARPWLAGLAAFVAAYVAHVFAIAGRVSSSAGYGYWLQGGPGHLWATLQFFAVYFGGSPWLLPVLVATGLGGAAALWSSDARLSAVLGASIAAPLVGFLVFGNGGHELATGAASGYWGILVVPLALALVPAGLASVERLLPGTRA